VIASIYTGTVRAYDVVTMLQRDGHPTALGEAIAGAICSSRYPPRLSWWASRASGFGVIRNEIQR
jgi:hypothetical protein